jgi:hypothetical protein
MQAQHHNGSGTNANTTARHLLATAMIGAALIGYQIHKTPDARTRLESLATMAQQLGELNDTDAALVARTLATVQTI